MKMRFGVKLVAYTAVLCCLLGRSRSRGEKMNEAQQKSILDQHNKSRRIDSAGAASPLVSVISFSGTLIS